MNKRVIVAMSGGVDSSVTAALLQKQGWQVEGVFMKNWSPDSLQSMTDCPWEQDQADAQAVCDYLGIPFRSLNFEKEYKEKVVDYFLAEYAAGRTPNPDILCNSEIKFKAFLQWVEEQGVEYMATGHYAQIQDGVLLRGIDPGKDQSYFLYRLNKKQLSHTLMPLGTFLKSEIREMALEFGLPNSKKKDSQGICFIGHIDLKEFLREHITGQPGEVFAVLPYEDGQTLQDREGRAKNIGRHNGTVFYTIGERAGELIDNGKYRKNFANQDVPPLYVLSKDSKENRLYVTSNRQDEHFSSLVVEVTEWSGEDLHEDEKLTAQIRYQQKEILPINTIEKTSGGYKLILRQPAWAVAPGQSLVVFRDQAVVGGGVLV